MVESPENTPNKNRLHFQIEPKNTRSGIGRNGLQLITKSQGREDQAATVRGLTLNDGDDSRKTVFADIGQELECV